MLDAPVLIFDCTDTEIRNFQSFEKLTLRKTPVISLLKYVISRLFKRENYYSLLQLTSLTQIWLGSFREKKVKKRFQETIKYCKIHLFFSNKAWE